MEILVNNWWRKSHQSSTHEGLRLFGFCVVPWKGSSKTPTQTMHGNKDWDGWNLLQNTETLTESTVCQWNSSGIFSQDSICCSSMKKSKVHCSDYGNNSIYVDVQRHFLWNKRQRNRISGKRKTRISVREKILEKDNGHLLVLVLRKSGTVSVKIVHKENVTIWWKGWCWN